MFVGAEMKENASVVDEGADSAEDEKKDKRNAKKNAG